jgi:D-3-phosphoglycerate dehydrogenase / 2-oxoglutarate reductase
MKTKTLITGALHQSAVDKFLSHSSLETIYRPDCSRSELLELITDVQVIVTRSETDIDHQVLRQAKDLKVIARAAVGVGNIDLETATDRGILVINCPGKNTNSAAELTIGLLIGMFRNIPEAQLHLKNGGWDRHTFTGLELRDKTIALVGLGNVGHRVAKFCTGLDMKVLAFDPYIAPDLFRRHEAEPVETLIEAASQCDILSVHVPLNHETRGMIDSDIFKHMKPGSCIINAARGGIINESDLLQALDDGHIAKAAIDTFEHEPSPLPELLKHQNIYVTPHIGASTTEAQIAIGSTIYDQVIKAVERGVVDYPVNLPEVGIIDRPILKTYATLSEKLGSLIGQIIEFNPASMEIQYGGDIAELDHNLIRMGCMKGYCAQVVDGFVSFVNVANLFSKLGVVITEENTPQQQWYRSTLKIVVRGADGQRLSVGGVVFDDHYPRINLINEFYFELEPDGKILMIKNYDRPGVIGDIGKFLASQQVNIDRFELSRNRQGGMAMALIRLDSPLNHQQFKSMREIENLVSIHPVYL